MDKETLIREIHDVLGIDAPFFYRIKRLLNEYQALSISDTQELCLLARLQTELELLLNSENKFTYPPAKPKIQTALNYVLQKKQSLLMPVEKKSISFGSARSALFKLLTDVTQPPREMR